MIGRATAYGPAFAAEAGFRRPLLEEHAVPVARGPTFDPVPCPRVPRATAEAEPRTATTLRVAARAAEALP
jgi:hypothetical protein